MVYTIHLWWFWVLHVSTIHLVVQNFTTRVCNDSPPSFEEKNGQFHQCQQHLLVRFCPICFGVKLSNFFPKRFRCFGYEAAATSYVMLRMQFYQHVFPCWKWNFKQRLCGNGFTLIGNEFGRGGDHGNTSTGTLWSVLRISCCWCPVLAE
jgi:hypothetical protein